MSEVEILTVEQRLERSTQLMVQQAKSLTITTQEDYKAAADALSEIKKRAKQVKDYWQKPKADAAAAHKTICDKEKEMLAPLNEAEKIIKNTMVVYHAALEEARRKAEEEAKKRKQEEVDRLLSESMTAEQNGDTVSAATTMAMAQMIDDMPSSVVLDNPKASGTSVRKTWKAKIVDPKIVPAYVNDIEVRTINMSALNQLARMTSGTLSVPGVEFYEESSISVRT